MASWTLNVAIRYLTVRSENPGPRFPQQHETQKLPLLMLALICLATGSGEIPILLRFCSVCHNREMKTRVRTLEGGAFSPLAAFAVLLVVVAGVAAFALARPDPAQPTATTTPQGSASSPDHSLTDAEAVARFKELDALRRAAYAEPDPAVASSIFAPEGPTHRIVQRELRRLQQDGVRSETTFKTKSLQVLQNQEEEIRIRQVVVVTPKFVNAVGRDVTGHAPPERQTIEWTLVWSRDEWLIENSQITEVEPQ